jgi:hypothetical protein
MITLHYTTILLVLLGLGVISSFILHYFLTSSLKERIESLEVAKETLFYDIRNIEYQLEKTEDAFQNDIRRHIEDLREDFSYKEKSNGDLFEYFKKASESINSFLDNKDK